MDRKIERMIVPAINGPKKWGGETEKQTENERL